MTSVNVTDIGDKDPDQEGWSYETIYFIETVLILGAIFTISCIVILVTFLQKLNFTLKVVLISLCIHNAVGFAIEAMVFSILSQEMHEVTCSLMSILGKSIFVISVEHLAIVSFIRYHLSTTTARNENANLTLIIGLVMAEYIIEYISTISGILLTTTGYEVSCLDHPDLKNDSIGFVVMFAIKSFFVLGSGMIFDYKLMEFLRNQNNASKNGPGEMRLVPWKTNAKEYDYLIPVSAGVVSGVVSVVTFILILFLTLGGLPFPSITFLAVAIPTTIMIIQIALTIRVAKLKKSTPPTIERKLNFHDTNNVDDLEFPQNLFHQAQLEENVFRRDVHSVAGDLIEERLRNVGEKLNNESCRDKRDKVIFVKPINESEGKSSSDVGYENQNLKDVQIHDEPCDDLTKQLEDCIQDLDDFIREKSEELKNDHDNDEALGQEIELVLNPALFLRDQENLKKTEHNGCS